MTLGTSFTGGARNGRTSFAANVSVPYGFELAKLLLPPLEAPTRVSLAAGKGMYLTLFEQLRGVRHRIQKGKEDELQSLDEGQAQGEHDDVHVGSLQHMDMLRFVVGGGDRWSEATIKPGSYVFWMGWELE